MSTQASTDSKRISDSVGENDIVGLRVGASVAPPHVARAAARAAARTEETCIALVISVTLVSRAPKLVDGCGVVVPIHRPTFHALQSRRKARSVGRNVESWEKPVP